jgi:hypothetical protein
MTSEKILTKSEIEEKLKNISDEEIEFIINMNTVLGNIGAEYFQIAINAVSKALFILQKDRIPGNIINITMITNKILMPQCNLNRAEVICLLYYLQQNVGTIYMEMEANEMPTWGIRDDIFKKLCF